MQTAALEPMEDRAAPETKPEQLIARSHSVLAVGELSKEAVRRARSHLDSYVMSK